MTAAEYRAEMAKPKREKASLAITRLFLAQIRARKLPEPRSKLHPAGELWFAKGIDGITRYKPGKTNRSPAWRFDFAWPEQRIAVEYQGLNVFKDETGRMQTSGGHADVQHFRKECEKRAWAVVLGWRVLEFERDMMRKGYAVDMLVRLFATLEVPRILSANELPPETLERLKPGPIQYAPRHTDELNFGGLLDRDPF